jgi:hypothetical protein
VVPEYRISHKLLHTLVDISHEELHSFCAFPAVLVFLVAYNVDILNTPVKTMYML